MKKYYVSIVYDATKIVEVEANNAEEAHEKALLECNDFDTADVEINGLLQNDFNPDMVWTDD